MDGNKSKPERKSFFFSAKFPKFHLNFGSGSRNSRNKLEKCDIQEKKTDTKEDEELLAVPKNIDSVEDKMSPNLSLLSSKFSTKSPDILKLRKNLLNACEKQCIESYAVTTSKIPILRAKMCDNTRPEGGQSDNDRHPKQSQTVHNVEVKNFYPQRTITEVSKLNFMNSIKNPDIVELTSDRKPKLLSIDTQDFLTNFLAEKATNRPVVQKGLVKERAKAFEKKIEHIKIEAEQGASIRSPQSSVSRPTSFKLGPSDYSLKSTTGGGWSSYTNSTPASAQSFYTNQVPSLSFNQSKHITKASPSYSWCNKGKIAPDPVNCQSFVLCRETGKVNSVKSFVPKSSSSGSGTWSSWSASTPASSTSISGVQPMIPSVSSETVPHEDKCNPLVITLPTGSSMNKSWTAGVSVTFVKSPTLMEQPNVSQSMTCSTSSFVESKESCKTYSSPSSEGENKVCDYFDDDYKDQPDLTINSIHETSEGPIATGGGESDAREICQDVFKMASESKRRKDSSLSASLESLEADEPAESNGENKVLKSGVESTMGRRKPNLLDNRLRSIPSMSILQDVATIKNYLNKLQKVLLEAGNDPLPSNNNSNLMPEECASNLEREEEIIELKQQIALLRQQNLEKDLQIETLRKQLLLSNSQEQSMSQSTNSPSFQATNTNPKSEVVTTS